MNDADIDRLSIQSSLADGQVHRERLAVLAPAHDLTADAEDPFFGGRPITGQVYVMLLAVGRGHQHLHVPANSLFCWIAEETFAGGVVDLYRAVRIDDNDAVDGGRDQRSKEGISWR